MSKARFVQGLLKRSPRGHGKLLTSEGSFFVSGRDLGPFVDGDTLRGRVQTDRRGRLQVAEPHLLRRRQAQLAGTLRRVGRSWMIEAEDGSFGEPILLTETAGQTLQPGWVVGVELLALDDPAAMQRGRLVKILGEAGQAKTELSRLLVNHGVVLEHPAAALALAAAMPSQISDAERAGREDLRGLGLVTIDGADARDFDDAIFVEEADGGFDLVVAIADVAHYVRLGDAIDVEAQRRGTSVYWPGGVAHMLPTQLAAGLCSLRPDEERLAMVCRLRYDAQAHVQDVHLSEAIMRSQARLTYAQVNQALAGDARVIGEIQKVWPMLQAAHRLAQRLENNAQREGRLQLDIPEAVFALDADGEPTDATPSQIGPGQKLIEHLMIEANRAVARWFKAHQVPGLYRVHEAPSEEKIKPFADATWALNQQVLVLEAGPQALNDSLLAASSDADRKLLSSLMLRCLPRAGYDPKPLGHFGLGLDDYLHFTSPIRRYPDLIVHRSLKAALQKKSLAPLIAALKGLEDSVNSSEREAMDCERKVDAMLAARMMQAHIGENYVGSIGGLGPNGLYVSVAAPMFEGYVRAELLQPDDYYSLSEDGLNLVGERQGVQFRLGAEIAVTVLNADPLTRQIDLDMVGGDPLHDGRRGSTRKAAGGQAKRGRVSNRANVGTGRGATKAKPKKGSQAPRKKSKATGRGRPGKKNK